MTCSLNIRLSQFSQFSKLTFNKGAFSSLFARLVTSLAVTQPLQTIIFNQVTNIREFVKNMLKQESSLLQEIQDDSQLQAICMKQIVQN